MQSTEQIIADALQHTEANGIIVFEAEASNHVEVFPYWEAESEADIRAQAIRTAIHLADKLSMGMITATWDFRDDGIEAVDE